MSQNFNKITPDCLKVHPIYLTCCLNSEYVQRQMNQEITDTVRTFLSLTKLKTIDIPVPPLETQNQFADVVVAHEKTRRQQHESARQSDHLFDTLLHRAFAGEL